MAAENDASRRCRENTARTRCGNSGLFREALADAQEILSLELGGTADQSAVHVLPGEEFRRV